MRYHVIAIIAVVTMLAFCGCGSMSTDSSHCKMITQELNQYINRSSASKNDKNGALLLIKRINWNLEESLFDKFQNKKIPFIALVQISEEDFTGSSEKETIIFKQNNYLGFDQNPIIKSIGENRWNFVARQFTSFSDKNCYLKNHILGKDYIILILYNGSQLKYAISSSPWVIMNENYKIPFLQRAYMTQMYFVIIALKETLQSDIVNNIYEMFFKEQFKTSTYFIYKKFKNSPENDNIKILKKIYPDEISID